VKLSISASRQDTDLDIVHEDEAPSGMLARGHYTATSCFIDDDRREHLRFMWSFDIAKDW
jgi:Rho GDP-dissociation inhibitor